MALAPIVAAAWVIEVINAKGGGGCRINTQLTQTLRCNFFTILAIQMHNITYTDIINNSKVRSRTNRQTEAFMCVAANKQQTPNIQQSNRGRARANWDSLYQIIKQNLHWQPAQSRVLSLPRTRTFLYFFKWSLAIVLEAFWGSFRVFLWALVKWFPKTY